jgi:hypothetical protein
MTAPLFLSTDEALAHLARPHIGTIGRVPLGDGLVMVIDGCRVVTIMPEGDKG